MADPHSAMTQCVVVEDELQFSLEDICHTCRVSRTQVIALVEEGVLEASGSAPEEWRFAGSSLRRARVALRLARDLELTPTSAAVVLDLLEQIEVLRSRLRRAGIS